MNGKRIKLHKDDAFKFHKFNQKSQVLPCVIRNGIIHDDASVLSVLRGKKNESELANYSLAAAIVNRQ